MTDLDHTSTILRLKLYDASCTYYGEEREERHFYHTNEFDRG